MRSWLVVALSGLVALPLAALAGGEGAHQDVLSSQAPGDPASAGALGGPAPRRDPTGDGVAPSACLGSAGNQPGAEEDLLVVPASQYTVEVQGPAQGVRLVVALCSGESLGAHVTPPPGCTGKASSLHVVGVSNGQAIADFRCDLLPAGSHSFLLESGAAAFSGVARLYNATFA